MLSVFVAELHNGHGAIPQLSQQEHGIGITSDKMELQLQ